MVESALRDLAQAREHLAFSSRRVADLKPGAEAATPEDLERLEAYTSRFARVVDLTVNKVLRAVDRHELAGEGTLLDVLHRAEKRGQIASTEEFRALKEVRNVIAHDYSGAELAGLLDFCRTREVLLHSTCDRIVGYARDLLAKP